MIKFEQKSFQTVVSLVLKIYCLFSLEYNLLQPTIRYNKVTSLHHFDYTLILYVTYSSTHDNIIERCITFYNPCNYELVSGKYVFLSKILLKRLFMICALWINDVLELYPF